LFCCVVESHDDVYLCLISKLHFIPHLLPYRGEVIKKMKGKGRHHHYSRQWLAREKSWKKDILVIAKRAERILTPTLFPFYTFP
jgi:hypothetical protein